jgi:hypothetical protein
MPCPLTTTTARRGLELEAPWRPTQGNGLQRIRDAGRAHAKLVDAAVKGGAADRPLRPTASITAAPVAGAAGVVRLIRAAIVTLRAISLRQLWIAPALPLALRLALLLGILVVLVLAVLLLVALLLTGLGRGVLGAEQRRGANPGQNGGDAGPEQTPAARARCGNTRQCIERRSVHDIPPFAATHPRRRQRQPQPRAERRALVRPSFFVRDICAGI